MEKTTSIETVDRMISDKQSNTPQSERDVVALLVLRSDLVGENIIKDVISVIETRLIAMKKDNKEQYDQILIEIRAIQSNQKIAKDQASDLMKDMGYASGKS